MGIENGGNFREAEELAPEGSSNKGKTLESKVQQGQMEGNSEGAKESHSRLEAQEQKVEQEVTPESSPQLLQIGPDFDENWKYYDNQDRAILKLKEGNIEELKIELKNALESGQIAFSEGRLKRLDLPEEQKKIKNQLQILESTIQALVESNDNLPIDLRQTLQKERVNGNYVEQINDKIQGRIELIRGRKRFRFLRIGQKEIQALERLMESIQTQSNEYTKLQNLEQNIVDRDIIIKFQQLPQSLKQSIYSLENPTIENINEVIDQAIKSIQSYQTPQELIDKREAAVKGIIDYLGRGDIDKAKAIRDEFGVSEERVQEAAKEGIISDLKSVDIDRAIVKAKAIRDAFGVSEERVQEAAKEGIIYRLGRSDIIRTKAIMNAFGVSVDSLKSDERVQEAAKEGIIYRLGRGDIVRAKAIRDEFGVSVDLLKSDKRVQEAAKEEIISRLGKSDIDRAKAIRDEFGVSVDLLKSDKRVQEAAVKWIIYLLRNGNGGAAEAVRDEFGVSDEIMQSQIKEAFIENLKNGNITKGLDLVNAFSFKLTYFETKAIEIFGTFLSYNIFLEIRDLENGVIGQELSKIGVTKAGKEGIQELASRLRELKSEFTKHNPENIKFENSEFTTNYFMSYTGYKNSGWGNTDRDSFLTSIQNTRDIKYRPLPSEFEVIETYQILKKEKSSNIDRSIYREDFLNRFSVLIEDIKSAKDNLENKKPLTNLVDQLNVEIENIIQNLKIKSQKLQDNPQAQIGLGKRIKLLEKINLRSIQNFQENFKTLSSFSELDNILRQIVFTMGFAKNRGQLAKSLSEISVEKPSLDDISWVLNFVDHITNQETMAKYFTDKKATKKFKEKINPTALIKQMDLLQNAQITSGTTNITFSTHRDFYTEISGQIADACWASKYKSILTQFPNFSSILMVKDKETQNERIVGASLLIETKAENGDELLIIRGLNPTETMINSLDVKSYFEAVVDYARNLADSTGKKLAISIDDNSGGHTTNRPLLFNYISNLKGTLKPVKLQNPSEANFNRYNLQGEVYLL